MQIKQPLNKDDSKLFKDCPRCFYLATKHNIERPNAKKRDNDSILLDEEEVKMIKKTFMKGLPLPSPKCRFCIYRQLVRESGIENELAA